MKVLVTGCSGFIGSHMVDRLLSEGHQVVGVDNLSTGRLEFLQSAKKSPRFKFIKKDLTSPKALKGVLRKDTDWVMHFAANADVRKGLDHPFRDLEQNAKVTLLVLEAMREAGVKNIVFSSTGSVYGEAPVIPTPETCPFPVQTSLYATSKLAAEGFISSFVEGHGFRGLLFRFVSILGERYTHGHVIDFVRQLRRHPDSLAVLGNGKQRKSYLYAGDCIEAILGALHYPWERRVEAINLGTDEYVDVNQSIDVICEEMRVSPKRNYSGGDRGWPGDNPFIFLDCSKMRATGWRPKTSIRDAVRATVRFLLQNPKLLSERKTR